MQWESDSSSSVLGAQSLDQQHQHRWAACSRCKFHLAWGFHPRPSESATLGRSQTSVFYEVLQMFWGPNKFEKQWFRASSATAGLSSSLSGMGVIWMFGDLNWNNIWFGLRCVSDCMLSGYMSIHFPRPQWVVSWGDSHIGSASFTWPPRGALQPPWSQYTTMEAWACLPVSHTVTL